MKIIPRLYMRANAKEAIELYGAAFGATVDFTLTYGKVGAGTEEQRDLIMNSQIDIGGNKFHLGDIAPEGVTGGNQITFTVVLDNPTEVKEAYERLNEGGKIIMEPQETFFSPCHCAVVDRFGIGWQINCPK